VLHAIASVAAWDEETKTDATMTLILTGVLVAMPGVIQTAARFLPCNVWSSRIAITAWIFVAVMLARGITASLALCCHGLMLGLSAFAFNASVAFVFKSNCASRARSRSAHNCGTSSAATLAAGPSATLAITPESAIKD
jgi:hypothetical protein